MASEQAEVLLSDLQDAINASDYTQAREIINNLSEIYSDVDKEESELAEKVQSIQQKQQLSAEERTEFQSFLQAKAAAEFQRTGLLTGGIGLSLGNESTDEVEDLATSAGELKNQEATLRSETTKVKSRVEKKTIPARVTLETVSKLDDFNPDTSEFTIEVTNVGEKVAESVQIKLSSSDSIVLNEKESSIGSISEGSSKTKTYNYNISNGGTGRLQLTVTSANAGSDKKTIIAPIVSSQADNQEFADQDFSEKQFNAVFGDDGDQTQDELSSAINTWFNSDNNTVNGVTLSQDDLSDLINYWFKNL
jgi:hypothetical protein